MLIIKKRKDVPIPHTMPVHVDLYHYFKELFKQHKGLASTYIKAESLQADLSARYNKPYDLEELRHRLQTDFHFIEGKGYLVRREDYYPVRDSGKEVANA